MKDSDEHADVVISHLRQYGESFERAVMAPHQRSVYLHIPISVRAPVPVTTATAEPAVTSVPLYTCESKQQIVEI